VAGYEPEEDEKVTATVIKKVLKQLIDELKESPSTSARKELKILQTQDNAIKAIEKRIRGAKADLKSKADELGLKLQIKRLGSDEFKAECSELLRQVKAQLEELDSKNKADKRKITALKKAGPFLRHVWQKPMLSLRRLAELSQKTRPVISF